MQAAIMDAVVDKVMQARPAQRQTGKPRLEPVSFLTSSESQSWNLAERIGFRFALVYLVLYILPFPLDMVPGVESGYQGLWNKIVPWTSARFLGINITVFPRGSGDTTFNYVQILLFVILAALPTIIWSILDRRRLNYSRVYQWLRLYVRMFLGMMLIIYGAMKIIPAQMPPLSLSRLAESYGDSSPMGLLWNFMGASSAYCAFAGGAEMLAAVLLIIPGLTALGSLIAIADMSNVFMLNMCYDVPVKLFSFHLLLMALFLAAPDLHRLAGLFLFKRNINLSGTPPFFRRRWLNRSLVAMQLAFGIFVVVTALYSDHQSFKDLTEQVRAPLYGIWSVDEFAASSHGKPLPTPDEARWKQMMFDKTFAATAQMAAGPQQRFSLQVDKAKDSLTLEQAADPQWKAKLAFQSPTPGTLTLTGQMNGNDVIVKMHQTETAKSFLLTSRGFHWISEYPYDR